MPGGDPFALTTRHGRRLVGAIDSPPGVPAEGFARGRRSFARWYRDGVAGG